MRAAVAGVFPDANSIYFILVDRLNQLYVDLLKRMDDSSNDVRLSTTETLIAYFEFVEGRGR